MMTTGSDIDLQAFLASTTSPAVEAGPMAPFLEVLTTYASDTMSGAQIRTAHGESARMIAADGCGAWLVAGLGEPAVIALRDDLRPGEATWHAARLIVRLGGSPLTLAPGQVGLIGSASVPLRYWPRDQESEAHTDELAMKTLRSMGASRRRASKYARKVAG